ncbi:MAG: tetratricopeptide repeat protein [Nitrospirae bacterium]|nr:MAG: tetratricopeptide repeat protein [Nitrospirota bacterium]
MPDLKMLSINGAKGHPDTEDYLSDTLLSQFSEFIAHRMGLHFPKKQWVSLESGIRSAARELGFSDTASCINQLSSAAISRTEIEKLAGHLTVGETFFLRDRRVFEIIRDEIIGKMVGERGNADRRMRIWSAGCSTGEEPYSIAVLLSEMGDMLKDWNLFILATDINAGALHKASEGTYAQWSFRDTPQWFKTKYFREEGKGHFKIRSDVKERVSFAYLNLVDDVYPSLLNNTNALDLIVCRNVLMYFVPELACAVVERFYRCLVEGGWLIIGPCEASQEASRLFTAVNFGDAVMYRKESRKNAPRDALIINNLTKPHKSPSPSSPPLKEGELTQPSPLKGGELIQPSPLAGEGEGEGALLVNSLVICGPVTKAPEPLTFDTALAFYEKGLYTESEEALRTLIVEGARDTRTTALLCHTLANQGRLEEALTLIDQAIVSDKCDFGLHYLRASIFQEQGELDDAVRSLNRVLYLEPDFVLGYFVLGNLLQRRGKADDARRYFETALSLLSRFRANDVLPLSEGMTAKRLKDIIETMLGGQK